MDRKSLIVLISTLLSIFTPLVFSSVVAGVKPQAVILKIIVSDQQKPGIDGVISDFLASSYGTGVSNVTVIASGTRANDQLTYLVTQMAAGSTEFDVFGLDPIWVAQFAGNNWVLNLDANLSAGEMDNYVSGMVEACTYGGHIWAYPYFMNLGMLYYRKDILARNGFNETHITTWPGLAAVARTILANESEANLNENLVGYVGQFDSYEGGVVNFFEWLGSNGVTNMFDSSGMSDLNNTKAQQVMEYLFSLIAPRYQGVINTSYIIPRDALVMDEGSSVGKWLAGNAIFMRQWTFAYGSTIAQSGLNATNGPGNYTQFGIVPLPTFNGTSDQKSSCVGGAVLSIPSTSTHKQEALNLVKYLGQAHAQTFELENISNFPALKSVYSSLPAGFEWAADFVPAFNKTLARPVNPHYSEISNTIAGYFSQLLSGYYTTPEALGYMDRDINEILAQATTPPISGYDLAVMLVGIGAVIVVVGLTTKKKRGL